MMKKTLCLFFVLALVAQICARPDDKDRDDAEETVKDNAHKTSKDGIEKAREAGEKGQTEAKALADKGKKVSGDLQDKAKTTAEALGKHARGGRGTEQKKHNQHRLSEMIRESEKIGEKLIERGTDAFANILGTMGF